MGGIILAVLIGFFGGLFFKIDFLLDNLDFFIDLGLCLLLFFVGIDIGKNGDINSALKRFGNRIWMVPLTTLIGTLFAGFIASYLTSLSLGESLAVSAGLGWYSLSAIELSKVSAELGGLAFLSNIFRELLAILAVPIVAKKIGSFESISTGGATVMDTLLPVINKSNSPDISVVAFFTGVVLSGVVPILVPFFISFFQL
jgi:uncharacterized membrane protein YbjE (DUF340 family)